MIIAIDPLSCVFPKCHTMKGEGAMCPRHEAIVEAIGMEKAIGEEHGYTCDSCEEMSESSPTPCDACGQKRCVTCAALWRCCVSHISYQRREIEESEGEVSALKYALESTIRKLPPNVRSKIHA